MALPALQYDESIAERPLSLNFLRKWLHGSWALLFSHSDDFAAYGFEADRWLAHVRAAFTDTNVRPLALASPASRHSAGWVTEAGGCTITLQTDETRRYPLLRDAHEQQLHDAIRSARSRFATVLDDTLRRRRTFAYAPHDRLPSPIDLVGMAEKLRGSS